MALTIRLDAEQTARIEAVGRAMNEPTKSRVLLRAVAVWQSMQDENIALERRALAAEGLLREWRSTQRLRESRAAEVRDLDAELSALETRADDLLAGD